MSEAAAPADAQLYRYVVKADRDFYRAIEKRASACGVSPTALVQRHFETILDAPKAAPPPAAAAPEDLAVTAAKLGITPAAMRVLQVLRRGADHEGRASLANAALAMAAGVSSTSANGLIRKLCGAGLLAIEARGGGGRRTSIYRLTEKGRA